MIRRIHGVICLGVFRCDICSACAGGVARKGRRVVYCVGDRRVYVS